MAGQHLVWLLLLTTSTATWMSSTVNTSTPTHYLLQQEVPLTLDEERKTIQRRDLQQEGPLIHDELEGIYLINTPAQKRRDGLRRRREVLERGVTSRGLLYTEELLRMWRAGASLRKMLAAVVQQEMKECHLLVAHDDEYGDPAVLDLLLLLLPNLRQVVHVNTVDDLLGVVWESSSCRGYLFLLDDPTTLLNYTNTYEDDWDHDGRFLFVGLDMNHLEDLIVSQTGKKTEHIVGAVKSGVQGEWRLYMNQLYWGEGVRQLNTWKHDRFTSQVDLFPDKISDLRGAVLRVVTFEWEPNMFYYMAENGSLLFRYGVDIDIVKSLAQVFNFTAAFEDPPPGEYWGYETADGNWTGLVGRLYRDEADVGVANMYISQDRRDVLEFSAMVNIEMICFMIRKEPQLPRWQALAFPFQLWTWLAILVCLMISGPVLFLLALASGRCGDGESSLQTLSFSWYYTFGLHFNEPQMSLPRMASTQVFVMFLWVYTMILTIAYSTNLTAFMVVSKQPATINTIKEIYDSGLIVTGIGEFFREHLASSGNHYLQRLSRTYEGYDTPAEIFPLVLEGRAVYLQNRPFQEFLDATRFSGRGVSPVRILKECFLPYNIGMGLQRHSPLKAKFDRAIGWLQHSGLYRHYFLQSLRLAASTGKYGSGEGVEVQEGGVVPLSLDHLQGIFFILTLGWIISLLLFLLEKIIFRD